MKIRECLSKELEKIVEINEICMDENYSPEIWFELWVNRVTIPIAIINGEIIGYLVSAKLPDGEYEHLVPDAVHICSIAVLPEYRKRGVATELMKYFLQECSPRDIIQLAVRKSNVAAQKLYQNFNFKKQKIVENYYTDGKVEDGIFMLLHF